MSKTVVSLYGRPGCGKCEAAKHRIIHVLGKDTKVKFVYYDMDTLDGRAEGAFNDVIKVPTVIVNHNNGTTRWDGKAPTTDELRACIEA